MGAHWQGIENRMIVDSEHTYTDIHKDAEPGEDEEKITDYCENYYCYECPQYGAYCEGREDNDERKQANV